MSNNLITTDQINTVVPKWQHPVLPGHAAQGSVLITTTNFTNPPQSSSNFVWKTIEDVCGTHDVKLEYNEQTNTYHIFKSSAHLNNDGSWTEDWYEFGVIQGITEEVQEALKSLVYVKYDFDTSAANTLIVKGTKKDGTVVTLCNLTFASVEYVNQVKGNLESLIQAETTRATNKENELDLQIDTNKPLGGIATDVAATTSVGSEINVLYDNDTIKINSNNQLYVTDKAGKYSAAAGIVINEAARTIKSKIDEDSIIYDNNNALKTDIIKDTLTSSNTKTWSIDKIKEFHGNPFRPMGNVSTFADLPTSGQGVGDVWTVLTPVKKMWYWGANNTWNEYGGSTYTAGAGIDITNNVVSAAGVSFATGDGLKVDGTGSTATLKVFPDENSVLGFNADKSIKVNVDDETIKVDTNKKLAAKINANGGIEVLNGLAIKNADTSLNVDNTGVKVKLYPNNNPIKLDNLGIYLDLDEETISNTDSGIGVKYDNTTIRKGSSGLEIGGTEETWTFTLDDGTTVNKKVRIF